MIRDQLTKHRKWVAIGASALSFVAILGLSHGFASPEMSLLYAGLDDAAAGDLITALEEQGTSYEVRGSSIFVAKDQRDLLRMQLASEGLPQATLQGYELLDSLSGFGTTSQMFDVAYLRAREGELARTILSTANIRAARVHISGGTGSVFDRNRDFSAAVTVTTTGAPLTSNQIQALRHLVSSAVAGLAADDVAIIDSAKGLLTDDLSSPLTSGDARSEILRRNVERMLEARVGVGNAVVEVSVETVAEAESIIERRIDPESRVTISSEVLETSSTAQATGAPQVTVASNLPDGEGAADRATSNESTETRTLTNFDVSELTREITRTPGTIKRISVAVLLNDAISIGEDGLTEVVSRTDEELDALRGLVATAVGFDETRGDVITLQSMAFSAPDLAGSEAAPPIYAPLDIMRLLQWCLLALVSVSLGLFVVRPALKPTPKQIGATETLPVLEPSYVPTPELLEPVVDRLRRVIGEKPKDGIQMLQAWIDEPDQKRSV